MIDSYDTNWRKLCSCLQEIHDKDWQAIVNDAGVCTGVELPCVFYTYKVEHYYRGYMQLIVADKKEDNWQRRIFVERNSITLKRYRRTVKGNSLKKAKDIARIIRKAEKKGNHTSMVSAYHANQTAQMIVAEIFTHVSADSIEISNHNNGGVKVNLFKRIILIYDTTKAEPRLSLTLTPGTRTEESTTKKLDTSRRLLSDVELFIQEGYTVNKCMVDLTEYGVCGLIAVQKKTDICNFTAIYDLVKRTEAGRICISGFMQSQMEKK